MDGLFFVSTLLLVVVVNALAAASRGDASELRGVGVSDYVAALALPAWKETAAVIVDTVREAAGAGAGAGGRGPGAMSGCIRQSNDNGVFGVFRRRRIRCVCADANVADSNK